MEALQMLGTRGLIDRRQFVRLILESLHSLGYADVAEALEGESGISLFSPEYHKLGHLIFSGQWEECAKIIETEESFKGLGPERRTRACFFIWQQCFLELLASQDTDVGRLGAVPILRHRIAPLAHGDWEVHSLALSIITSDPTHKAELILRRGELFEDVVRNLDGWVRVPQRRLERLVEMASIGQQETCRYHNMPIGAVTLYEDHRCSKQSLPWHCSQTLNDHKNKVVFLQFSHNGLYLASSCSDDVVIIWQIEENTDRVFMRSRLRFCVSPVPFIAWSPDDTMLLTFRVQGVVSLWDVETGTFIGTIKMTSSSAGVNSCAWFPDSQRIALSRCVVEQSVVILDLEGNCLDCLEGPSMPNVSDLALTPDGQHLISIYSDRFIRIRNLQTRQKMDIGESGSITSLSLSGDGRHLIVNLDSEEIHLWSVLLPYKPPQIFKGHKQANHATRSCFGGSNSMFLASGSEDAKIYIWHRGDCMEPVLSLEGHSNAVNCVSWNPTKPYMLASASDDCTIRIWCNK